MFDDAPEPDGDDPVAADVPDAAVATPVDPPADTDPPPPPPDLDVIEADLAAVEVALERLDSGEYWTDETTGEPLTDSVLEQRPTARRNT